MNPEVRKYLSKFKMKHWDHNGLGFKFKHRVKVKIVTNSEGWLKCSKKIYMWLWGEKSTHKFFTSCGIYTETKR